MGPGSELYLKCPACQHEWWTDIPQANVKSGSRFPDSLCTCPDCGHVGALLQWVIPLCDTGFAREHRPIAMGEADYETDGSK